MAELRDYLRHRGLQDTVMVRSCGCLGGCGYGPNVAVPPSPRVFLAMDLERTKRLLKRLGLDGDEGVQGGGP
jgi:(2Fe-2S) ferredoxin